MAQYAPLQRFLARRAMQQIGAKTAYLTSSSPFSQILKPPSGCFNLPNQLHLKQFTLEIPHDLPKQATGQGQLTFPSDQSADRPLRPQP